jgi:hypothetical protein
VKPVYQVYKLFIPVDPVVEIEYLQPELVGEHLYEKTTIVDVRCKDARNRHFIVEMQISLHKDFLKRVLFNACKVYSRHLPHYVQTYNLAKVGDPNSQMEGIHFHFIELSKFMKNGTFDLKNPLQAWMKFFAEPEYFSTMPIKHYETFEELKKAIEMLDESNFTEGQLYAYDKYMDNIRTQKSIEAYQRETGLEEGRIAGRVEGRTESVQLTLSIINELRNGQLAINQIAEKFQVTEEVVAKISNVISNSTLL